eukprot:SAG31_NODE_2315_length_5951_cov_9.080472_5_plen_573_part_01
MIYGNEMYMQTLLAFGEISKEVPKKCVGADDDKCKDSSKCEHFFCGSDESAYSCKAVHLPPCPSGYKGTVKEITLQNMEGGFGTGKKAWTPLQKTDRDKELANNLDEWSRAVRKAATHGQCKTGKKALTGKPLKYAGASVGGTGCDVGYKGTVEEKFAKAPLKDLDLRACMKKKVEACKQKAAASAYPKAAGLADYNKIDCLCTIKEAECDYLQTNNWNSDGTEGAGTKLGYSATNIGWAEDACKCDDLSADAAKKLFNQTSGTACAEPTYENTLLRASGKLKQPFCAKPTQCTGLTFAQQAELKKGKGKMMMVTTADKVAAKLSDTQKAACLKLADSVYTHEAYACETSSESKDAESRKKCIATADTKKTKADAACEWNTVDFTKTAACNSLVETGECDIQQICPSNMTGKSCLECAAVYEMKQNTSDAANKAAKKAITTAFGCDHVAMYYADDRAATRQYYSDYYQCKETKADKEYNCGNKKYKEEFEGRLQYPLAWDNGYDSNYCFGDVYDGGGTSRYYRDCKWAGDDPPPKVDVDAGQNYVSIMYGYECDANLGEHNLGASKDYFKTAQ